MTKEMEAVRFSVTRSILFSLFKQGIKEGNEQIQGETELKYKKYGLAWWQYRLVSWGFKAHCGTSMHDVGHQCMMWERKELEKSDQKAWRGGRTMTSRDSTGESK
ncbi:hypothetical protein Scep_012257 [Stephania cephalantha]|uniref:Uncharacterized protein n=1 Tax=Stephania cephalantha TaxID=152367 RepID=A0AAP0P7B4_9MAGN